MCFFLLRSSICLTAYCMSLKLKTKSPGGLLDENTAAVFAQCTKSMKSHKVFKSGIKLCHFPCTILVCVQYETSVWKMFSFNGIAHNNLVWGLVWQRGNASWLQFTEKSGNNLLFAQVVWTLWMIVTQCVCMSCFLKLLWCCQSTAGFLYFFLPLSLQNTKKC